MPRLLVKRTTTVLWVPTLADPAAPKAATELTGGTVKDLTCHIVKGNLTLGATDSDTTDETDLCAEAKGSAITDQNYEFNASLFRYFTVPGLPDTTDFFTTFKGFPTGYIVVRTGKVVTLPFIATDVVDVYGFTIDTPRPNFDEGYHKLAIKGIPTGVMKLQVAVVT